MEDTPTKRDPTPLPKLKLFVIGCINLGETFAITMIFPFIAAMIEHFEVADTKSEIGFYAGLVASCFNFAQFLSAMLWGILSDRIGRRPVLLFGLVGNFVAILLFGFSDTLLWAILACVLNGILNGNVGVAKCYILEISDDSNSARAFSFIGLTYGIGIILGPAVGGFLSYPHINYPDVFAPGTTWETYPFLLPCILSASINLVGVIVGWFVITETLPTLLPKPDEDIPLLKNEGEHIRSNVTGKASTQNLPKWKRILFHQKDVLIASLIYALLAFITIGFDEVYSVWTVSLIKLGGLEFTSAETGATFIVAGVALIVTQLICSIIIEKFGTLRPFQISAYLFAPFTAFFPFLHLFISDSHFYVLVACCGLFFIRYILEVILFTCVFLFVNHSADPDLVGFANGIAQSCASLSRGLGPLLGGIMLTWSVSNGLSFPFNHYFTFFVFAIISLVMLVLTLLMPATINHRKVFEKENFEKA